MKLLKENFSYFFVIIGMALLISSCGGRQEGETRAITGNLDQREADLPEVSVLEEYPIPTAAEVAEMLQRAGAPYILGISNPTTNVDKYMTERAKAINLGVYGAGLSYAGAYEMNQDIRRYLQVCKRLIDELNISTSFNQVFLQRVERNLNDKDSLINIVSESFYDTYVFLTENRRDDLSLLVIAGSWIEGMYLTSQIAIGARDNSEITNIIVQQGQPLQNLLELLDDHSDDDFIHGLYHELDDIHSFISDQGSPMTNAALDNFVEMISALRHRIIS